MSTYLAPLLHPMNLFLSGEGPEDEWRTVTYQKKNKQQKETSSHEQSIVRRQ